MSTLEPEIPSPTAPDTPPVRPGVIGVPWWRNRSLAALVLVALALGVIYNFVLIVGKGPDEPRHMNYVRLLLEEHTLPYLEADGVTEHGGAHTFHPPLYYLVLLPVYAVTRGLGPGGWHFVRLVSLLLCVGALPLIYQIATRAGRGDNRIGLLATAQVALLPMFGMTSGTINNDSATLLAVTLFLWLLAVRYPDDRSWKAAAALGICCGLGTMCKATALLLDVVAFIVYLIVQDGKSTFLLPRTWGRVGILLLFTALIAGPWHLRSMRIYGTFTPLPLSMPCPALPSPKNGVLVLMLHDNFPRVFTYANTSLFSTQWSQKDWIPEDARTPIYIGLALYCLTGILGAARKSKSVAPSEGSAPSETATRIARWCPAISYIVNWVTVLQVALFWHWGWAEGGRYLLPSLCGFSILIALGWRRLVGSARLPTVTVAWTTGLLGLNALAIFWLIHYLNPTFGNQ